ncbi:hydrogenase maturation protease [Streptomyces sp. NPDC004647]|uniref:hydrogenase maturation protease n=1 Tax=Streptomyces sp. NPDC004647 TaxID=3154671 RepID=UPI0033BDCFE1
MSERTPDGASTPRTRTVTVDGVVLRRGSRVRLRPSRSADIFDLALAGRNAEVDTVEEDFEGRIHVAVVLQGDPGRDFGVSGQIGHRFFFSPEEVEPAGTQPESGPGRPRVLVAGIGNVFLADDAFGPEVIAALRHRPLPDGVHVADFGIRGMDLAYRLLEGYDAALLVDAAPRGHRPGTVSVIEPEIAELDGAPEAHAMDPVKVLALARRLGDGPLPRILIVGCEPLVRMNGDEPDVVFGLSAPVQQAVGEAVRMVETLVGEVLDGASAAARATREGEEVSPR